MPGTKATKGRDITSELLTDLTKKAILKRKLKSKFIEESRGRRSDPVFQGRTHPDVSEYKTRPAALHCLEANRWFDRCFVDPQCFTSIESIVTMKNEIVSKTSFEKRIVFNLLIHFYLNFAILKDYSS